MPFQSVKCFAAVAGLAIGTAGNLCTATDADTTVDDQSGALQEIVEAGDQDEALAVWCERKTEIAEAGSDDMLNLRQLR